MRLLIMSPQGTIADRQADSVELPGGRGRFTVLRGHAPLITTLERGDVSFSSDGQQRQSVAIGQGLAIIKDNVIKVYI